MTDAPPQLENIAYGLDMANLEISSEFSATTLCVFFHNVSLDGFEVNYLPIFGVQ